MSDRYTRKDAEAALERLACAVDNPLGHYRECEPGEVSSYDPRNRVTTIPGGWALDWNPTYGGYVVEQIADDGGTWVSHPFGETRMSARDFCSHVRFALAALHHPGRKG